MHRFGIVRRDIAFFDSKVAEHPRRVQLLPFGLSTTS